MSNLKAPKSLVNNLHVNKAEEMLEIPATPFDCLMFTHCGTLSGSTRCLSFGFPGMLTYFSKADGMHLHVLPYRIVWA